MRRINEMRSNKYKKCTIQVISVKGIICSEKCDIDWGEGRSYCQRQQFSRYARTQGSCGDNLSPGIPK